MVKRPIQKQRLVFPWKSENHRTGIVRNMTTAEGSRDMSTSIGYPNVSHIFRDLPILRDELQTDTSEAQLENVEDILPHILGDDGGSTFELNSHGMPKLKRQAHVAFLRKSLEKMPAAYTAYDAARPWVIYWTLTALCLLGQDVSEYQKRFILHSNLYV